MNVRLNLDLNFSACIWYNKQFQVNSFLANVTLVTNTLEAEDTSIAIERCRWWSENILTNSVLIHRDNEEKMQEFWGAGLNVVSLPAEPTDQTVAMLLYSKLNAICESKIVILDIQMTSQLGNGVRFIYDDTDDYGPFTKDEWWNSAGVDWFNQDILKDKDGTLRMKQLPSWHDVNLHWVDADADSDEEKDNIVEVDFKHDDKG